MEELMDTRCNFGRYRQALRACDPPAFPYFGIVLRDCAFVDIGNSDRTEKGFVNFEKMRMHGDIIRQFRRLQNIPYRFPAVFSLQNYLKNLPSLEENALQRYSMQYERAAEV